MDATVEIAVAEWYSHFEKERDVFGTNEPKELEDAFCRDLAFGTGGLRGKLGVGPNRMNRYTVARATQGLADWLNARCAKPSVAVCRDTRRGSEEFARTAAEVLAANGVRALLFERPEPTPALSFAVRELGCSAGINITASHNPAEYNGYKVYGPDGCQVTVGAAREIQAAIDSADIFEGIRSLPFAEALTRGLVSWAPESVLDAYVGEVLSLSTGGRCSNLKAVYTPLHGTGLECVSRVLEGIGVGEVLTVTSQCAQDGSFPTCPKPNPEVSQALEEGLSLCRESGADLLVATDPDADRMGVAVRHGGGYATLTGNELGLLLLDFLAGRERGRGADLSRKVVMTTVVSSPMADDMARSMGFELRRTLTGFKFIGEQVGLLVTEGRGRDFLMGFEESCGYLAGTGVRDKDGVLASMLACELAAHWKARGMDLVEAMEELYGRYGWWRGDQVSVPFEGAGGPAAMREAMSRLRGEPPASLAGIPVSEVVDYLSGAPMPVVNPGAGFAQALPPSDVLELRLADGSRALFRPSGTEPKAKAYLFARGETSGEAGFKLAALKSSALEIFGGNPR